MAKSVFQLYKKDESKVLSGVWVKVGDVNEDGILVKIAFAGKGNAPFQDYFMSNIDKTKGLVREREESETKKLFIECLIRFILKDWKNVKVNNEKGEMSDLPFNEKNARFVLENCDDLFLLIFQESQNYRHFTSDKTVNSVEQGVEKTAKKSSTHSSHHRNTRPV